MRVRFPLLAKILLWFFLNLGLLGLVCGVLFGAQFRFGLDSLLAGRAGDRVRAVSGAIVNELQNRPRADWDAVLERFGGAYGVEFALLRRDGGQAAGNRIDLPPEVRSRLIEGRGAGHGMGHGMGRFREGTSKAPELRFQLRTSDPARYWVGICVPLFDPEQPWPLTLLLISPSLRAGGLLLDFTPWLAAGFGAVLLSVLFWIPLVRSVTRSVSQMTSATESIADGRFTVRVDDRRADELGRLGQAVNRMAERLGGFVSGQKRFLGDIAHELGSPLARLEMALGVLEDRVGDAAKTELEDAREEAGNLSKLVHELLSFSRAGLNQAVNIQTVNLAEVVREVVKRETGNDPTIEETIDPGLRVRADADLLSRALGNLIRNAVRYAGSSGPVAIRAERRGDQVILRVLDRGPGVAGELLQRVFDPFFRAEPSRSRDTGGMGLGLAIVKTCVEACGGSVTARNREPHGFEVEITLKVAI